MSLTGTFTILNSYLNCEHAMYRRYIKRDGPKYVETPEMAFGNAVHSAFEYRIGSRKPLPENMLQWESFASPFDGMNPVCELKLGVNKNNKTCDYWGKDCFFRGKNDVTLVRDETAYLVDFKTGKSNYEDPFELETNAMLVVAKYPKVKKIVGSYCWLKENRMGQLYDLSDIQSTWSRVCELLEEIESKGPDDFTKNKSGLCGYCAVEDCENWYNARARK